MKTLQENIKNVKRAWHLIDAKDAVLGRTATKIANLLMGKNKVIYTPNVDMGDSVVVLNAGKVKLTGKKMEQKVYRSHSGYPKGFKEVSLEKLYKERPEEVVKKAVSGMLPQNRLKKLRLARLTIVRGNENPFADKFTNNEKTE